MCPVPLSEGATGASTLAKTESLASSMSCCVKRPDRAQSTASAKDCSVSMERGSLGTEESFAHSLRSQRARQSQEVGVETQPVAPLHRHTEPASDPGVGRAATRREEDTQPGACVPRSQAASASSSASSLRLGRGLGAEKSRPFPEAPGPGRRRLGSQGRGASRSTSDTAWSPSSRSI